MSEPENGSLSVTFVDSLTRILGFRIPTHRGMQNALQNLLPRNGDQSQNVDDRRAFGMSYFIAHFVAICYYCFSNNSRTVRLISLASGQRKIRRKFRRISLHLLLVVGDGGTYLSRSFPLFFPLSRFHSTYHMVHTVHFEN